MTRRATNNKKAAAAKPPSKILSIDIGGTKVKILASGHTEPRKIESDKRLTPARMIEAVGKLAKDWEYRAVSIGYPGQVGSHGPRSEPRNLGPGWVGFNFAAAFEMPVRIVNDAAMQALGSYEGGRMLFLGLGTGLGSVLIAEDVIFPLELGELAYGDDGKLGALLGRDGMKRRGKKQWRRTIENVVPNLLAAFQVDYVMLGGGNAKEIRDLPPGARLGHNLSAFEGGFRLWHLEDVGTLSADGKHRSEIVAKWRLI